MYEKKENEKKEEKYYPVYNVDGEILYAKKDINLCSCNGSLHIRSLGCY